MAADGIHAGVPTVRCSDHWRDRDLIAARLDLREGARIHSSSTVLQADYAGADHPNYDVHPDGKRFVVLTGRARPQRLTVALDAFPRSATSNR